MTVGRPILPWLLRYPDLACQEIIARWAPLAAYLCRRKFDTPTGGVPSHASGYGIVPNIVFEEGTEASAKSGLGYRLGMTMAEWSCVTLMGLPATRHVEMFMPGWTGSPGYGAPDLFGYHPQHPRTWVIEAKGSSRLQRSMLRKGAYQLDVDALKGTEHLRVLCGATLEHRLLVTIDLEYFCPDCDDAGIRLPSHRASQEPHGTHGETGVTRSSGVDESEDRSPQTPEDLVELAQSRLLTYLALESLPSGTRRLVPVARPTRQRRSGGVSGLDLLERDRYTARLRAGTQARDAAHTQHPYGDTDMLVAQIPGTELWVGMSRGMFEACRVLTERLERTLDTELRDQSLATIEVEMIADVRSRSGWRFRNDADNNADVIASDVWDAYREGETRTWEQTLNVQLPRWIPSDSDALLEAADHDSYLATTIGAVNRMTMN